MALSASREKRDPWPPLSNTPSPVHVNRLPGNETTIVADQEQARRGDLVYLTLPPKRDPLGAWLTVAIPFRIVPPRIDTSR